ncbi:MAG: hypothetical protein JJT76_17435 [Clostridiaceae bacterium]|nr:hypothetical protein [Clostridiaceae bacterium]
MKNKKFTVKSFLNTLLLLLLIILLIGCNNVSENPQGNEDENNTPELPEVLEEMEEDILNTMYDIDALEGIQLAMEEKEAEEMEEPTNIDIDVEGDLEGEVSINGGNGQEEQAEEGGNDTQAEEENGIGNPDMSMLIEENAILHPLFIEEEIEGSATAVEDTPDSLDVIWFDIHNQIEELHRKWNVLEADLRDVNAPQNEIEAFEETLNNASLQASDQKRIETLLSLNELTKYLAGFRNAFEDKVPGEVFKMRYHLRHGMILAHGEEYQNTQEHIDEIKEIKNSLQQELNERDAQHVNHKFDLSIEDLEDQLVIEDFDLIQTKGAIVMKNIGLIEDTFRGSIE